MTSRTKPGARRPAGRRPQESDAGRRVERVRRLLLRRALPRVQMALILAATGAAGFLASFALLHAGVWRMWLRYALAVLAAYLVFLLLLRLWLFLQGRDLNIDFDLNLLPSDAGRYAGGGVAPDSFGGGGDFAGGGASGGWDGGAGAGLHTAAPSLDVGGASGGGGGGSGGGGGLLDSIDFGVDDEGCVFFLLAVALIVAGTLAALYVVYAAPVLLAEILVEGVLLSGLYRGVKRARRGGDWLRAAVRRTWLPVLLTLLTFSAAGYLLQRAAPRARSIGEAWRVVTSD
ncbi:MAG TPA: hypothetical protein VF736_07705 [Pyrinomonadaceae bacterium]|jgi:hypothetical protein